MRTMRPPCGGFMRLDGLAQARALLVRADALRDADVIDRRQVHDVAARQRDVARAARALGADRILGDLDDDLLALADDVADRRRLRDATGHAVAAAVTAARVMSAGASAATIATAAATATRVTARARSPPADRRPGARESRPPGAREPRLSPRPGPRACASGPAAPAGRSPPRPRPRRRRPPPPRPPRSSARAGAGARGTGSPGSVIVKPGRSPVSRRSSSSSPAGASLVASARFRGGGVERVDVRAARRRVGDARERRVVVLVEVVRVEVVVLVVRELVEGRGGVERMARLERFAARAAHEELFARALRGRDEIVNRRRRRRCADRHLRLRPDHGRRRWAPERGAGERARPARARHRLARGRAVGFCREGAIDLRGAVARAARRRLGPVPGYATVGLEVVLRGGRRRTALVDGAAR